MFKQAKDIQAGERIKVGNIFRTVTEILDHPYGVELTLERMPRKVGHSVRRLDSKVEVEQDHPAPVGPAPSGYVHHRPQKCGVTGYWAAMEVGPDGIRTLAYWRTESAARECARLLNIGVPLSAIQRERVTR